jgi:CRISPR-associated protein Cas1
MEQIRSSDLKTILHSKRANIYYLEYCRVLVNGGRVEYVTEDGKNCLYWNIPIANTTSILLGTGTSVTQAAMRELARAGVLVGFCGGGGTPLYHSVEREHDIAWFCPQSEYRPTEYLHAWFNLWTDESKRLSAAKKLQEFRIDFIQHCWIEHGDMFDDNFKIDSHALSIILNEYRAHIQNSDSTTTIFTVEARFTKQLYKMICEAVKYKDFARVKQGEGVDLANQNLDYGNYLAYGLGATATWVLGLPHGLSILHGKTRRGGLVFDAADLIKDGLVLPQAFVSGMNGQEDQEFRVSCIRNFLKREALDFIINSLKEIAQLYGSLK